MQLAHDLRELLAGWQLAGVTHLPAVKLPELATTPTSEPDAIPDKTPPATEPPVLADREPQTPVLIEASVSNSESDSMPRMSKQAKQDALTALAAKVAKCKRCQELASTRTQTVFGVGNPNAKIMFIGEAPGADEDAKGEPFVGRAGQLLNKIIEACDMQREEIYICNILRCRPPGNRNPSDEEAANCREFLDRQIEVVNPKYIVCWGTVAARNLLGSDLTIGKLRGEFHKYGKAKVLCTYHPSYLLRNPSSKKDVWIDMQFLFADMGITLKS